MLYQNASNPFNSFTAIRYTLPAKSRVSLSIYNVSGFVKTLVDEFKPQGEYNVQFDSNELPSGIYFYQLKSENSIETKKLILLK